MDENLLDEAVVEYDEIVMNYNEQAAFYQEEEILFTTREFGVLYLLIQYQGYVLSKKQIYRQVTSDGERDDYHTIEITISRIRKKLELYTGRKDYILTIRNRGYKVKKLNGASRAIKKSK